MDIKKQVRFILLIVCCGVLGICISHGQEVFQKKWMNEGEHNKELKKVLDHYQKVDAHPEKYAAAKFLIENLAIHKSEDCIWITEDGMEIYYDEMKYPDYEVAKERLQKIKDSITVKPISKITADTQTVSADFLIKNIDMAYKAWKENPWSSTYSFEVFCEYILPYRGVTEAIHPTWREDYKILFEKAARTASDPSDPVEVISSVIADMKGFRFIPGREEPQPFLSADQLLFRREGSCPDLANAALLAGRALGVAVTFDFTPHFAASSNAHFWNTVIDTNGEHIPFNGNQTVPYTYNANYKRLGKVFRYTYGIQKESLALQHKTSSIPEGFLREKNIIDVTPEYVETAGIHYQFFDGLQTDIAYINVFNLARWRPVHWAKMNTKKGTVFNNMGTNIVYLPSRFVNNKMIMEPFPILLNKKKETTILRPNFKHKFSGTLSRKNETKHGYEDYNTLELEEGKKYRLLFYQQGWNILEESAVTDSSIKFNTIPDNALLLLLPEKPDGFERVFTLDKDTSRITWY